MEKYPNQNASIVVNISLFDKKIFFGKIRDQDSFLSISKNNGKKTIQVKKLF